MKTKDFNCIERSWMTKDTPKNTLPQRNSKGTLSLYNPYGQSSGITWEQRGNHTVITRSSYVLHCYKIAATLLLLFTIGIGNVWGAEEIYKTALFGSTNNSAGNSSYTGSFTATNSGFIVNVNNFNNNNNGWSGTIKCGRKNNASVATIITNASIDKKITKVSVKIESITSSKTNSIKLYTSANNSTWTEIGSYSKSSGTQSVSIASANQATNLYYKIEFDCASGSSNGFIGISKVEYYYDAAAVSCSNQVTLTKGGENNGSFNLTALKQQSYLRNSQ